MHRVFKGEFIYKILSKHLPSSKLTIETPEQSVKYVQIYE